MGVYEFMFAEDDESVSLQSVMLHVLTFTLHWQLSSDKKSLLWGIEIYAYQRHKCKSLHTELNTNLPAISI